MYQLRTCVSSTALWQQMLGPSGLGKRVRYCSRCVRDLSRTMRHHPSRTTEECLRPAIEQSQRDRQIQFIAEKGRMAWQKATDYGRRALAETTVGRYKAIIGPKLHARSLLAQQGEAAMAVKVLNRMIRIAKPTSVRIA
jgi:hypothetical protein